MILKRKAPRVNFLIAGTQKGGTSALDVYLRKHPQIGMAHKKEIHFFDNEELFAARKVNYKAYEDNFNFEDGILMYGEATPIYMYWQPACIRIRDYNPEMKLLFILRNPVERAFSHWNMEFNRGEETNDFSYCIRRETERLKQFAPLQHRVYSYTDRGFYARQIYRFKQYFKDEQMLFIKYEDFKGKQEESLNKIFNFLGVNPNEYNFTFEEVHTGNTDISINPEDKEFLIRMFKEDIKIVEGYLSWDCKDWIE